MNPYDVLEVPKDAPKADVKRAFRRKAKKAHSDKGGNDAEMRKLSQAYAIISCPKRRAHFDETGDTGENAGLGDEAARQLAGIFAQCFASAPETQDLIALCRRTVGEDRAHIRRQIPMAEEQIAKCDRALKRLKFKGEGEDLIRATLVSTRDMHEGNRNGMKANIAMCDKMLILLESYAYEGMRDNRPRPPDYPSFQWGNRFETL